MNEVDVKREIAKLIRSNQCRFQRGSSQVMVSAISDVSITIWKINEDNPALDNYEFDGNANLSIVMVEGSISTQPHRIKGYAKVTANKPPVVQISIPVSVYDY